jgi:hypothetical protein
MYHAIGKLLAKQREDRYQSATEFLEALADRLPGQVEPQYNHSDGQSIIFTSSDEVSPTQMSAVSQHKGRSNGENFAEGQLIDQTTGSNRRSFLERLWGAIMRRGS